MTAKHAQSSLSASSEPSRPAARRGPQGLALAPGGEELAGLPGTQRARRGSAQDTDPRPRLVMRAEHDDQQDERVAGQQPRPGDPGPAAAAAGGVLQPGPGDEA